MSPYNSPPDPKAYREKVWEIARQIPAGKVSTYGQIGAMIPPPEGVNPHSYESMAPRWVGGAMASCPDDVPWQRVINSQGKISLRPGGGGSVQRERLEAEGIEFNEKEKIDLKKYRWTGPSAEWLHEHGFLEPPMKPGDKDASQIDMGI